MAAALTDKSSTSALTVPLVTAPKEKPIKKVVPGPVSTARGISPTSAKSRGPLLKLAPYIQN